MTYAIIKPSPQQLTHINPFGYSLNLVNLYHVLSLGIRQHDSNAMVEVAS